MPITFGEVFSIFLMQHWGYRCRPGFFLNASRMDQ
jgi:hypothetical protein